MVGTRTFRGLFIDQIRSLYSAETQLLRLLPRMTRAATLPALKQDFLDHIEETKMNLERLEALFRRMEDTPWGKHCSTMQGIVYECRGMTQANYCQSVRDAGLIAGAQRIEHYETTAYGTARAFALQLHDSNCAEQLHRTMKVTVHGGSKNYRRVHDMDKLAQCGSIEFERGGRLPIEP